jgi:hypothetical protein
MSNKRCPAAVTALRVAASRSLDVWQFCANAQGKRTNDEHISRAIELLRINVRQLRRRGMLNSFAFIKLARLDQFTPARAFYDEPFDLSEVTENRQVTSSPWRGRLGKMQGNRLRSFLLVGHLVGQFFSAITVLEFV